MKNLASQNMRGISAESDALHLGMTWSQDDLSKPHIIIESSYGESHPGSSHLNELSSNARYGVIESGGRPAKFIVTDMCDGVAQGSSGMELSLLSRDVMAAMIEIHVSASLCDGLILVSSCDKSVPAHLMAAARMNMPTIFVPGGCMIAGANFSGCDQMWEQKRLLQNGEISCKEFYNVSAGACPSAGACQMMGTAGTMQVIAESLGLALTGTALIPATNAEINRFAKQAGKQILSLLKHGIKARHILSEEAFENAITVHAAVGGSTNAIMHLIAIANELNYELDFNVFNEIHKRTPYLTNILSTGYFPTELFWYAGGVPAVMNEIRDLLHLDVLTVTGHTLGENLDNWLSSGRKNYQNNYLKNYRTKTTEIIRPRSNPIADDGGVAILKGNIAPLGAIIKHSAVVEKMMEHVGRARVFTKEDDAIAALQNGLIQEGDIIVIPYQGPKACGMPELFRISDVIASNPALASSTAVITDGRYSGCPKGPAIGYVSPEACDGGPIGLIKDGDLILIDIPKRQINLVKKSGKELINGCDILSARKKSCAAPELPKVSGVRAIYQKLAKPSLQGGGMKN